MIETARVAVLGGDELVASVVALGLQPVTEGAEVAVIDLRDPVAIDHAATLPRDLPRVLVGGASEARLSAALGLDPASVVGSADAPMLGPALMAAVPPRARPATRVVVVTGTRGGVGRTTLVVNLARRLSSRTRVTIVDATGTGAVAWWLDRGPRPWSDLEGMADEMTSDHLAVAAESVDARLRLVGGSPVAPTASLLAATIRAAAVDDLVLVDAPILSDPLTTSVLPMADRVLALAYDDRWSMGLVAALPLAEEAAWLIASQTSARNIGGRTVFRMLPRDEASVAAAIGSRGVSRGRLGRAYDGLAELLLIDAA